MAVWKWMALFVAVIGAGQLIFGDALPLVGAVALTTFLVTILFTEGE